ncbi:RND transporter [Ferdinandcohnia sp. Marseille-Q9671]
MVIFILIVLIGIITATVTMVELKHSPALGEDAQSRIGFRWGSLHIIVSIIIIVVSAFLAMSWKRLFPFNMPVAIVMAGLCYALFFLTFTIGWVGIQGMVGFLLTLVIGIIMIISYSLILYFEKRKTITS